MVSIRLGMLAAAHYTQRNLVEKSEFGFEGECTWIYQSGGEFSTLRYRSARDVTGAVVCSASASEPCSGRALGRLEMLAAAHNTQLCALSMHLSR
jgi:hypothetical protein